METIIYFGNPLTEWLIALTYILSSVILARLMHKVFFKALKKLTASTVTKLNEIVIDSIKEPIALAIVLLGFYLGYSQLKVEGSAEIVNSIFQIVVLLDLTWLAARLLDAVVENVISNIGANSKDSMIHQIEPILRKTLRSSIWILGVITAMNNVGFDVGAMLAGVGIGGLALAMAAKDFVANIFGGVTVFIDKPFKVGDRIIIDGIDGVVKEIGIRSSKITTLYGRMVTIPNKNFTNSPVENITAEPSRRADLSLGLTYNTSPERLQEALDMLNKIITDRTDTEDECTIWFNSFGDFSLNINCIYYIKKSGHWANTPGGVNLAVLTKFNEAKLDFAFPTRTIVAESA